MFVELTIRNLLDIEKVIEQIRKIGADEIGLTDKNGMPDNLLAASEIKKQLPSVSVTTYYSLKNHTSRDIAQKYEHLKDYFKRAAVAKVDTILLVSGNPKPKFDTLHALDYIKINELKTQNIKLAIAYNPFFENESQELEDQRLHEKEQSKLIDKVFLQIGTETNNLRTGVNLIKKIFPNAEIGGSILVPTPFVMSRFELRPWKGVAVSDEFLSSIENALKINKMLLTEFHLLGIKPIFGVYTITPGAIESLTILTQK